METQNSVVKKTPEDFYMHIKIPPCCNSHCADSHRPMKRRYHQGIHHQARYIHIVAMLLAGRIMNWELSTLHITTTSVDRFASNLAKKNWNTKFYCYDQSHIVGMSLFKNISESRTCEQAGVPAEFCMKGTWKELRVDDPMAKRAADAVLNEINYKILHGYHHMCQRLILDHIIYVHEVIDKSGSNNFLACVSNTVVVMLEVTQNRARFDARVMLFCNGSARVVAYPIRINQYGHTAYCVNSEFIRYFCYCHHARVFNFLYQLWPLSSAGFVILCICFYQFHSRSSGVLTYARLLQRLRQLQRTLSYRWMSRDALKWEQLLRLTIYYPTLEVLEQLLSNSWSIPEWFLNNSWTIPEWFLNNSWTIPEWFLNNSWTIPEWFLNNFWTILEVNVNSLFIF